MISKSKGEIWKFELEILDSWRADAREWLIGYGIDALPINWNDWRMCGKWPSTPHYTLIKKRRREFSLTVSVPGESIVKLISQIEKRYSRIEIEHQPKLESLVNWIWRFQKKKKPKMEANDRGGMCWSNGRAFRPFGFLFWKKKIYLKKK